MTETKYVYESPDGGHTIYRRQIGSTERTLHSVDNEAQDKLDTLKEDKLWGSIRRSSKKDPVLQEMLEKIKTYHLLKNTP